MIIKRHLKDTITRQLQNPQTSKSAIIIYGARQVGKTTLAKEVMTGFGGKLLFIDADLSESIDILKSRDLKKMQELIADHNLLFIDEAQRIENIGINLKILVDNFANLKIIATSSSSFELANKISESLAGRVWVYSLFPISFLELKNHYTPFELKRQLEERLVFGSYPKIFNLTGFENKRNYLKQIIQSYLYKDVLQLADIKYASKIRDLVRLLAYQIGSQVSLTEIGASIGLNKDTIINYIDLMEKCFIIFRLSGFSRNLRKEMTKMNKIYFYDLGVRNALIDNFKPLNDRNDQGQLWENFLICERMKMLSYKQIYGSSYFWRLHTGAEIDLVEEREGKLFGFEFKLGDKIAKEPKSWRKTYDNAEFQGINQENYLDFIL